MTITVGLEGFHRFRSVVDHQFHVQMRTRAFGSCGMLQQVVDVNQAI